MWNKSPRYNKGEQVPIYQKRINPLVKIVLITTTM